MQCLDEVKARLRVTVTVEVADIVRDWGSLASRVIYDATLPSMGHI